MLSLPPVADALLTGDSKRGPYARGRHQPCCYDAIVVLGGGIAPAAPPYTPEPDLTDAADRIWQAARLFHARRWRRASS